MTNCPLYNWKSFWLGVLVIVSLGWAWVRSMNQMERFSVSTPLGSVALVNELGWVGIFPNAATLGAPRIDYNHEAPYPGLTLPFDSLFWEWQESFIAISYRFLVLLFLVP